jgi:signal transduction histidine kinase
MCKSLKIRFNNFLNGGTDITNVGEDEFRRIRLVNITSLLAMIIIAISITRNIELVQEIRLIYNGITVIGFSLALSFIRLNKVMLAVHFLCCSAAFNFFVSLYFGGGIHSSMITYLPFLPLLGGLMGGKKVGLFWGVLSVGGYIFFLLWEIYIGPMPNLTPPDMRFAEARTHQFMQITFLSVFMLSFLTQVESAQDRALKSLDKMADEIKEREKAETEALEASRSKSQFLDSMSHELRTPLNSVLGFSDRLLRRLEKNGELTGNRDKEAIISIQENGRTLLNFFNQLIHLSKFDSGEVQVNKKLIEVDSLVSSVMDSMSSQAMERGITLSSSIRESSTIYADISQLQQILVNLVSNALKYTNEGEVLISTERGRSPSSSKPHIIIRVKDTGIGIEENNLNALFDIYTNISSHVQKNATSTGLGLALCKRLIALNDGEIGVTTELGKGSEFSIYFPTQDENALLTKTQTLG